MTFDKMRKYLTIDEAARYLSEKRGEEVRWTNVFRLALDGHLPLVVKIPPGTLAYGSTEDGRQPRIEGVWDLVMEGEQGKHARRDLDRKNCQLADLPPINTEGIEGAWVERDGERRQLFPYSNLPKELTYDFHARDQYVKTNPALPHGCILGARAEAVEALLTKEASSKSIKAAWEDVTFRFFTDKDLQIKVHNRQLPPTNYAALGFESNKGKTGKPNQAWELFVKCIEAKPPRIKFPAWKNKAEWKTLEGNTERRTIQNRRDEICKTLRDALKRFGYEIHNKAQPFELNKSDGGDYYEPNFHIELASSYGQDLAVSR
jgi:hypothetical protein